MSHRHALRTIATSAVALLLPLATALPAAAAPVPAATLSPALLSAMQRDLGLTAAEAADKVADEQAAASTDESLKAQLGSAHSGSHVDGTGTLVVRTSDPAAAPVIRAAGAQPVVQPPGRNPEASKAKLDRGAAKAAPSVTSWYVEEQTGKVVVQATDPAAAETFVAQTQARADAEVEVQQVAEAPRLFANLVGGEAIFASNGGRCSVGFSARSSSATVYVITAGHCTEGGGTWSGSNRTTIGPVAATNFPGDDFGAIRVSNTAGWTPTSQVAGTSSVLGSTAAAVGASTCRSGSTTGYRCGTIQAKNATVNYGGGDVVYGLTQTSACAEPGDSGGSFVAGRQAQGMTSGGSGNCTVGGTTFFQPLNETLSRYGLTLVTG